MWKPACLLVVVAAGVFAAVAQSGVARPQSAFAPLIRGATPVTFQDSVGEDPANADITTVVVSNDDSGLITFQIAISNRPQLTSDMHVDVFVDTDKNATNGGGPDFEGAELAIDLVQNSVALGRWNGSKFDFSAASPSSLSFAYANGATFRIKASDLGATSFNFWAATQTGSDPDIHLDYGPDAGHGTWAYDVKVTPVPPTSQLRLVTQGFGVYPKHPKAPGQLNVYLIVRRLDTGAQIRAGQVVCQAKIGTKSLPPLHAGEFYKGTVNCNWQLPKSARGKTLTGSIIVTFQGAKVARNFSVRIG